MIKLCFKWNRRSLKETKQYSIVDSHFVPIPTLRRSNSGIVLSKPGKKFFFVQQSQNSHFVRKTIPEFKAIPNLRRTY